MVAELAGLVYIVIDAAMTPVKGGGAECVLHGFGTSRTSEAFQKWNSTGNKELYVSEKGFLGDVPLAFPSSSTPANASSLNFHC